MVKKNKTTKKEEHSFAEEICRKMQTGPTWEMSQISIKQICDWLDDGKIVIPDYQRDEVWPVYKKRGVIETILEYGGGKIPRVTFRRLDDGKLELIDGLQRTQGSIKGFVENKYRLSGVYHQEFKGKKFKNIVEDIPDGSNIATAFLSTSIEAQIASDMTYEDAKTFFIQINNNGMPMSTGEQIHAMQGTLIMDTIEQLDDHPVWDCVLKKSRYNTYEYITRFILYCMEMDENTITVYNSKQLLREVGDIASTELPGDIVPKIESVFDLLAKTLKNSNLCLFIREFFDAFLFSINHLDELEENSDHFKSFINWLYKGIHNNEQGVFIGIKQKPNEKGYDRNTAYYRWYLNNTYRLWKASLKGVNWNELQRLSLKG